MAPAELIEPLQTKHANVVKKMDLDALKRKEEEETLEIERRLKEMEMAQEGNCEEGRGDNSTNRGTCTMENLLREFERSLQMHM